MAPPWICSAYQLPVGTPASSIENLDRDYTHCLGQRTTVLQSASMLHDWVKRQELNFGLTIVLF